MDERELLCCLGLIIAGERGREGGRERHREREGEREGEKGRGRKGEREGGREKERGERELKAFPNVQSSINTVKGLL